MSNSVSNSSSPKGIDVPLAIVGMACRLPGADGLSEFWELLSKGRSAVGPLPAEKLDRTTYFDPQKSVRGKTYSEIGGLVTDRDINWDLLNIDPKEAHDWDECHLNLCEVVGRACQDAGLDPHHMSGRRAGVFIGHSGGSSLGGEVAYRALLEDYLRPLEQTPTWSGSGSAELMAEMHRRLATGRPVRVEGKPWSDAGSAASIISRSFGLQGPHMSIDAACASSLVALAMGALSLQSGQTELAIVGGASYNKADSLILFSQAQSCSASASRPFDEHADGLISSEGYVAIIVKTLERAQADGDRIQAVVRGIGISTDGRGKSLWAPRKEGQYAAISRAYSAAVAPDSVQLIEAHATSTHLGDATEMEALASFYGQHLPPGRRLPVGSVKSNIGHTLETAGLAGVVKSVLAIQHAVIPPSIHVSQLSHAIPWQKIPLYVARTAEAWPQIPAGMPRRAAVNAFGIGGLNVHVVVEQYLEPTRPASHTRGMPPIAVQASSRNSNISTSSRFEPIAILGRGVVLPAAPNLEAFRSLLYSSQPQEFEPNQDATWRPSSTRFGKQVNFQYDWRKHKVPPKQIAQANPLQFMLLEATEQAFREAHLLDRDFDRERTAVVVGNTFGGDFGNALYAGLRLPALKSQLLNVCREQGISADKAVRLAAEYEAEFLKHYPALLDETGSFTSSTLASRLSKTFNLMGGAMAMDAGDTSSLAALNCACQLLQSGTVDYVVCAAAHSALDRAGAEDFRQLLLRRTGGQHSDLTLGEGAAVVLLKRLSSARRDGDQIVGTIDSVGIGFDASSLQHSFELAAQSLRLPSQASELTWGGMGVPQCDGRLSFALPRGAVGRLSPSPALARTGYLQAAQGLTDLIAASLLEVAHPKTCLIAAHSASGQTYLVQSTIASHGNSTGATVHDENMSTSSRSHQDHLHKPGIDDYSANAHDRGSMLPNVSQSIAGDDLQYRSYHFAAGSLEQLRHKLKRSAEQPDSWSQTLPPAPDESKSAMWRAIVVATPGELSARLEKLSQLVGNDKAAAASIEQGLLWRPPHAAGEQRPKVAWLFPGQGSQYAGMLRDLITSYPAAATAMAEANRVLGALGEPSFEELAWNAPHKLGEDVWRTQAAMLVADWIQYQVLVDLGLEPDIISGHSYGEFAAMLASGAWDLPAALRATRERCRVIVDFVPRGNGMLSVQLDAAAVQSLINEQGLELHISHRNAPRQTVVGGRQSQIAQLAQRLEEEAIVSRVLSVPTAFHTPALENAVAPFRTALEGISISPPNKLLLSSVNLAFVAEPTWIRDGLAQQLVRPVDFVGVIERLKAEGVTHILEVGPQQILSRLIRHTSDGICVLPTDSRRLGARYQMQIVEAAAELFGFKSALNRVVVIPHNHNSNTASCSSVAHFDATQARKSRVRGMRSDSRFDPIHGQLTATRPAAAPSHFDATEKRRVERRSLAQQTNDCQPSADANLVAGQRTTIENFLIDFVVEQTGYPAEIIELDWDIEADLGIDSIKKAQLFGELREFFDLEVHVGLQLDDFRTLRDIANLLQETPGKGEWLESQPTISPCHSAEPQSSTLTSNEVAVGTLPEAGFASSKTSEENNIPRQSRRDLTAFLIDFVVEQTGYPPEIVELDADLEADLGIDSIKKAQLFGELREMFSFTPAIDQRSEQASFKLDDIRTLRQILELLEQSELADELPRHQAGETISGPMERVLEHADSTPTGYPSGESSHGETEGISAGWQRLPLLTLNSPATTDRAYEDGGYAQAVTANLRAMASRRSGERPNMPTNGHVSAWRSQIEKLAGICRVAPQSLEAFNGLMTGYSSWRVEIPSGLPSVLPGEVREMGAQSRRPSDQSLSARAADSSRLRADHISWFARLEIPSWLNDASWSGVVPIGLVADQQSGVVSLGVAGCTNASAFYSRSLLVLGDCDSSVPNSSAFNSGHASYTFSQRLKELHLLSSTELVAHIQSWSIEGRWWVAIVDSQSQTITRVESLWGTVSSHTYPLQGWADISWRNAMSMERAVYLGFDLERSQFVVSHPSDTSHRVGALIEPVLAAIAADARQVSTPIQEPSRSHDIARRYVLRMIPAPQRVTGGRHPEWAGAALVIGDNPVARQLEARLRSVGVETTRMPAYQNASELARRFTELAAERIVPHLFLATSCDQDAAFSLDEDQWKIRRNKGLLGNYWLCQKWLEHVVRHQVVHEASLIAVSTLGGDFGISGRLNSAEGSGLGGLLKSILIESWMQGHRSLPIKTIDTAPEQSPAEVVDCIWRELAVPSYDNEVSYAGGVRRVVRAIESPLPLNNPADMSSPQALTPGGTWVFTGGARGITAYVAEKLAKRYQLKVHLLGKSSLPEIDRSWRDLNENGLKQLKMDVMTSARTRGENPVQAWQNTEKAIEIDATLRRFSQAGIEVYYHSCDVADRLSLRTALDRVRELSGPIHGVVHGAGVGKDSRFDRKQETKVNQCIEAKVDGSLALMEATAGDPLEAFIGFGSISGRFGANGHTDYSMANDMLCKQVNWLRRVRPNVKAVGFHWHAWGDIGMATKPETRLALEMIDMQFMPAEEGFRHLVAELESSSSDSEILITDDRYYRMFYPAETLVVDKQEAASNGQRLCSLIEVDTLAQQTGSHGYTAVVDPARDPFLTEHTLDGRPLLPFVIGTELLWEAAVLSLKSNQIVLSGIEAQNALRFFNTDKRQLTIEVEQHEAEAVVCRLSSDFVSRDGRIVGGKRINFVANAAVASASDRQAWPAVQVALPANATWVAAKYPAAGSKFYVGWSFQRLRKVCLVDGQVIGRISAPALVELAGGERNVRGWKVPCAALDACFFAVGMLAWQQVAPGSALPVRIGRLSLGRLPMPGESCEVHARLNSSDGDRASFDFTLYGVDGDVLISVHEYEIAWMASEKPLSRQNPAPQQRG